MPGASVTGADIRDLMEGSGERRQAVLLVDDEVDILASLKTILARALPDVQILTAESGAAALRIVADNALDLIVTDYKMPGMNGLDMLREAARLRPRLPSILITAYPDVEIAIRAINEAEIQYFLTKPFNAEDLLPLVRAVLAERNAQELRTLAFARSLEVLRRELKTYREMSPGRIPERK